MTRMQCSVKGFTVFYKRAVVVGDRGLLSR